MEKTYLSEIVEKESDSITSINICVLNHDFTGLGPYDRVFRWAKCSAILETGMAKEEIQVIVKDFVHSFNIKFLSICM